jgi:hypothetical protein
MSLLLGTLRSGVLMALLALATAAAAQQSGLPRVGWVISATPENGRHLVDAMRAGLADEGLDDGRNVVLDVRYTAGRPERYPELFADLMRSPVNVLAAAGYTGISAARARRPLQGFQGTSRTSVARGGRGEAALVQQVAQEERADLVVHLG